MVCSMARSSYKERRQVFKDSNASNLLLEKKLHGIINFQRKKIAKIRYK